MLTPVLIPLEGALIHANLSLPDDAKGIVLFSHGHSRSHLCTSNHFVAQILHQSGMATLLTDLLTPQEDSHFENRFDIDLLTRRLVGITEWALDRPALAGLGLGYFGCGTGAAAAIRAAALLRGRVRAVVSRGGRPDLAQATSLASVEAPTLFIVGSLDELLVKLNKAAYGELHCPKKLELVADASHKFCETGKLEEVARLAAAWFSQYLVASKARPFWCEDPVQA